MGLSLLLNKRDAVRLKFLSFSFKFAFESGICEFRMIIWTILFKNKEGTGPWIQDIFKQILCPPSGVHRIHLYVI